MFEVGDNDVIVFVIDVFVFFDNYSVGKFVFFNGYKEDILNFNNDDDDVSVLVIDLLLLGNEKISVFYEGYLEVDELFDGSDEDEVEGSYNFVIGEIIYVVNGDIIQDDEDDEDDDEDEDEEDEDEDVFILYIGFVSKFFVF